MKEHRTPVAVGGSSLLVIFVVLCLTLLAVLGVSTVQADERLMVASANSVVDYYKADCEAEEILALLRNGEVPEGVTEENGIFSYQCEISDVQKLVVEVEIADGEYRILRWQSRSSAIWEEETGLDVWDGGF